MKKQPDTSNRYTPNPEMAASLQEAITITKQLHRLTSSLHQQRVDIKNAKRIFGGDLDLNVCQYLGSIEAGLVIAEDRLLAALSSCLQAVDAALDVRRIELAHKGLVSPKTAKSAAKKVEHLGVEQRARKTQQNRGSKIPARK